MTQTKQGKVDAYKRKEKEMELEQIIKRKRGVLKEILNNKKKQMEESKDLIQKNNFLI